MDAGVASSGMSYAGDNKWRYIESIDPTLEFDAAPKNKIDKWNKSTQKWLKNYIYLRVYPYEKLK